MNGYRCCKNDLGHTGAVFTQREFQEGWCPLEEGDRQCDLLPSVSKHLHLEKTVTAQDLKQQGFHIKHTHTHTHAI